MNMMERYKRVKSHAFATDREIAGILGMDSWELLSATGDQEDGSLAQALLRAFIEEAESHWEDSMHYKGQQMRDSLQEVRTRNW